MARRASLVPVYRLHRSSGQARVCLPGDREIYLGKHGSPESLRAYERLCAELRAATTPAAVVPNPKHKITVSEVVRAFAAHAATHYRRPDGTATSEVKEYRLALAPLRELYGDTPAEEFGPIALQTYRRALVDKGWCRNRVNKQVGRIRRVFRWAVSEELVAVTVVQAMACVQGLQRGRTDAKESEPIAPVAVADVEATLPHLNRHQRCMVRLQLVTGARPGEIGKLSLIDVAQSGAVWVWRVDGHKMEHAGRERLVFLGPKAQELIAAFVRESEELGFPVPEGGLLFSPLRAREERFAEMRRTRRCKIYPSEAATRRKANPKRSPKAMYTAHALAHAVEDACEKAGVPAWGPNRLRHTFATAVRKSHGLEAAQVLLGHARANVTEVYAERNAALALRVAAEVG